MPARSRAIRTASTSASSRSTRIPASSRSSNYNVVDDVGTVINPLLLHGQVDGGIARASARF